MVPSSMCQNVDDAMHTENGPILEPQPLHRGEGEGLILQLMKTQTKKIKYESHMDPILQYAKVICHQIVEFAKGAWRSTSSHWPESQTNEYLFVPCGENRLTFQSFLYQTDFS